MSHPTEHAVLFEVCVLCICCVLPCVGYSVPIQKINANMMLLTIVCIATAEDLSTSGNDRL